MTYQTESTCPEHTDAGLIWKFGEKSAGRGLVVYCEQPGESADDETPAPVTIRTKAAPESASNQYHTQDGLSNFEFGYESPNSARSEKGNANAGTVAGSYSYIDGHGLTQKIDYVADANGYRVTDATNGAGVPIPIY